MRAFIIALAWLCLCAAAQAQSVEISGHVRQTLNLSTADLKALPAETVEVSFESAQGRSQGKFVGVRLWMLVDRAGLADTEGRHPDLHHSIEIHARDGYRIIMSLGEIDPDFGNKQVILAYSKDGQPISDSDAPRLIVPGDRHGARDVRAVDRITID